MFTLLSILFGSMALMIQLVLIVLSMIAGWKVYEKAGEPGWKSLIPVYNQYTLFKISWNTHSFWIWIGLTVILGAIEGIAGDDPGFIMTILSVLANLATIYYQVKLYIYLAKSFGLDWIFGIVTYFINFIGFLYIGFSHVQYNGPAGWSDQGIF
ncbi:MAG: DUF5684 domain-containing protein [Floccifex sp.]